MHARAQVWPLVQHGNLVVRPMSAAARELLCEWRQRRRSTASTRPHLAGAAAVSHGQLRRYAQRVADLGLARPACGIGKAGMLCSSRSVLASRERDWALALML